MNPTTYNALAANLDAMGLKAGLKNAKPPARVANVANVANFDDFPNEEAKLATRLTLANVANSVANFSPWPELDPLPEDELPQSGAFPFHAMGAVLGDAARAIARSIQLPDAMAGGSVLGAASLVCQPLADVLLPHGGTAPLSLYVITASTSGDRKSASDKVACHVIEERRNQQSRDNHRAAEQYKSDMAARAKGDPEPIEPPKPQALTIGNATVEGISRLLTGQSSVGVFSPDGGDMLGGHSMRGQNLARQAQEGFSLRPIWHRASVGLVLAGRARFEQFVAPALTLALALAHW